MKCGDFDMRREKSEEICAKQILEYIVYFIVMCFLIYVVFIALQNYQ